MSRKPINWEEVRPWYMTGVRGDQQLRQIKYFGEGDDAVAVEVNPSRDNVVDEVIASLGGVMVTYNSQPPIGSHEIDDYATLAQTGAAMVLAASEVLNNNQSKA